jgi:hypothetical protein
MQAITAADAMIPQIMSVVTTASGSLLLTRVCGMM